ncbi:MAG: hypothetical protein H7287_03540 [Thermoleophilia bacterium]|nr:hypothetical protein [Thermoleophilia bacterium]
MNVIKNLPTAAKVGIGALAALLLAFAVYSTMLKAPAAVELISTPDYSTYTAAMGLLENAHVAYDKNTSGGMYKVSVAPDDLVDAQAALGKSGLADRTKLVKKISCGAAPGVMATKAANDRASNCADASAVQGMLLAMGATAAIVNVTQQENNDLLAAEMKKKVSVQVFLPQTMRESFDPAAVAKAIVPMVSSSSLEDVFIGSIEGDKLVPLWDGTQSGDKQAAGGTIAGASATGSLSCADAETATEITTKAAAVSNCTEEKISRVLDAIVGNSDYYALTVNATINASAKTVTTNRSTPGSVTSKSTQKGGGTNNEDLALDTGNETVNSNTPAGGIAKLNISVTLDKSKVSANQVVAIKQQLQSFIDPSRNDPAPKVTLTTLHKGGVSSADAQKPEQMQAAAALAAKEKTTTTAISSKVPMPMIVLLIALVVGLVATVMVMLTRSSKAAAERERYAAEFSNQQQLFNNFAQQDPQAMARDLESMFGAPSATRGN